MGTVFACSTPTVDGTDIDNSQQGASTGKRANKRAPAKDSDSDDDESSASPTKTSTTPTSTAPRTDTTAVPTTTSTTTGTSTGAVTPPPTTTATTPPPATQPSCGRADPIACLTCCLDANPGAVAYEDDYQFCMDGCPQGDIACLDDCQRQHVAACKGNASCTKNHACMEANNCLAQNYCNPI